MWTVLLQQIERTFTGFKLTVHFHLAKIATTTIPNQSYENNYKILNLLSTKKSRCSCGGKIAKFAIWSWEKITKFNSHSWVKNCKIHESATGEKKVWNSSIDPSVILKFCMITLITNFLLIIFINHPFSFTTRFSEFMLNLIY